MKVRLELREFSTDKNVSKKKEKIVTQTHCPGFFNLRSIGVDRNLEVNSEEEDDIDDAFMGQMRNMNVSGAAKVNVSSGGGKGKQMPDQTTSEIK